MSRNLPPYDNLVRWTVKDVIEWLKKANLLEFKDQFTSKNIDGNRLSRLKDIDVDNFIGKAKKKTELKDFISRIQKPKQSQIQTSTWATQPKKQPMKQPMKQPTISVGHGDDSDHDSIYSWGDDFGSNNESDPDDDSEEAPSDADSESNYEVPEDTSTGTNSSAGGSFSIKSFQSAFTEFQSTRRPSRVVQNDIDQDENYVEPIGVPPNQRPPPPIPSATTPVIPGLRKLTVSSAKKGKKEKNDVLPVTEDNYDIPDVLADVPGKRRKPPLPPSQSIDSTEDPTEENYMNAEQIKELKKSPRLDGRKKGNNNNGYVAFDPAKDVVPSDSRDGAVRKKSDTNTPKKKISVPSLPPVPKSPRTPVIEKKIEDELSEYEWYHHEAERSETERRLRDQKHNGMFLVRKSLNGGLLHPYTLMVFYESKVFNFPIRKRDDGQFAVGKRIKPDELVFATIPDLIDRFHNVSMVLNAASGYASNLTKPLQKR